MNSKIIYILLILSFTQISFSQINLVPNPSFEEKNCCPDEPEIGTSPTTTTFLECVKDWNNISNTRGTSDYFNACDNSCFFNSFCKFFGVPDNNWGKQDARNGNAYAGIYFKYNESEFIQVKLKSTLTAGRYYKVGMFVNLGGDNLNPPSYQPIKGLGILLTTLPPSGDGFMKIDGFTPQIININPISDRDNWTEISGDFIANGGEEWLTIGVFDPASAYSINEKSSYAFIDDVYLYDGCCPQKMLYENTSNLPHKTQVSNDILVL